MKKSFLILIFLLVVIVGAFSIYALQGFRAIDKSDLIKIYKPKSNEIVKSPLEISGEARGYWFFEASFPIKIFDENNNQLGISIAEAQSEWMTENFVNFKSIISFSEPRTDSGFLILEKDNPSGLEENADELKVPIRFR